MQRRGGLKGALLTLSLMASALGGLIGGAYTVLSLWFLLSGGPDLLVAEFTDASTEARVAAGQVAPQVAVVLFFVGGFVGVLGACALWKRIAIRGFGLDRQDAERIMRDSWNPRPYT